MMNPPVQKELEVDTDKEYYSCQDPIADEASEPEKEDVESS